jgi:hypothetical protein
MYLTCGELSARMNSDHGNAHCSNLNPNYNREQSIPWFARRDPEAPPGKDDRRCVSVPVVEGGEEERPVVVQCRIDAQALADQAY